MKMNDLKKLTMDELKKELEESLREHFNLRMQKGTDQLTRPHLFKNVKANIARIRTLLREKELAGINDE